MDRRYILAIDQGTTGSRAVLVNREGCIVADAYRELRQILPQPGWVEHDPQEISSAVVDVIQEAVQGRWETIEAIGITNQRETAVMWSRSSSKPVHNAIVWQDRRTATRCDELSGHSDFVREHTGLIIDPYFSATKISWMLSHLSGLRDDAEQGRVCFGTVDSWLIWKLTNGRAHVTDVTNASRTMLYNIHRRCWDPELLSLFQVPGRILPEVRRSSGVIAHTDPAITGGHRIPIAGVAGDQQAALFGQRAWRAGQAKNTYGTGAFLLMNVGDQPVTSRHGLLTTLAVNERGEPVYALEGSIFVAGAAVQWLRDGLGIIDSSAETAELAASVADNGGVYFIPAFVGVGAPHWRSDVRGAIFGLTRGTQRAHFVRAALEAIAYQTREVLDAMQQDAGIELAALATDGGASRNDWLMQYQADVLNVPVERAPSTEMTAIGAAYLSGLATGFWKNTDELRRCAEAGDRFTPKAHPAATRCYQSWQRHLRQVLQ